MPRVHLTNEAEESRLGVWLPIAENNVIAADHLLTEIDNRCALYAEQPHLGEVRPDLGHELRSFRVGNYVVIYQPVADGIVVHLVIHGARDIPKIYRDRFAPPGGSSS